MKDDRTDLMLFIDLGFILLAGFLGLTDTTPIKNVPLPASKAEEQQARDQSSPIYEILFDTHLNFLVLTTNGQVEVCSPTRLDGLVTCLTPLVANSSEAVFVLAPQGRATVQQLVSLLDLCFRNTWRCTVDS